MKDNNWQFIRQTRKGGYILQNLTTYEVREYDAEGNLLDAYMPKENLNES